MTHQLKLPGRTFRAKGLGFKASIQVIRAFEGTPKRYRIFVTSHGFCEESTISEKALLRIIGKEIQD